MNREIKFEYIFNGGEHGIETETFTLGQIENSSVEDYLDCSFISSAKTIAKRQYTGLKDKNGVEIYEGDIVKDSTGNSLVRWNEYFASFCLERKGWLHPHWFGEAVDPENLEVIGNIYENEELLTK